MTKMILDKNNRAPFSNIANPNPLFGHRVKQLSVETQKEFKALDQACADDKKKLEIIKMKRQ